MNQSPVRVLILGAHPDDAEFHAGGLIAIHRKLGNHVRIVSVTNGAAGHHERVPSELIKVRRQEAQAVAKLYGVEYEVWDFPDGELQPTLDVRRQIIRAIRTFQPDLVLTHRPNDYHPDHRAVGVTVQDASYMVTVPHIVPEVPALRRDPVVAYMNDLFMRPNPLTADVALDVTGLVDEIVAMLACHASQVFEWLPYNRGMESPVPSDANARIAFLKEWYLQRARAVVGRYRTALIQVYGSGKAEAIQAAEVYEISEYAAGLDSSLRNRLFPREPA